MIAQNLPYCLRGVVKTSQKPASALPEAGPVVCSVCASVINSSGFNVCSRSGFHLYSAHLCFPSLSVYICPEKLPAYPWVFSPRMTDTVTMTVD